MTTNNSKQTWTYTSIYETFRADKLDFANIGKSHLSKYTEMVYVPQYVVTEESVALFVNPEQDSELTRVAKSYGAIKEDVEVYTTFGLKKLSKFNAMTARIKFSDESILDYFQDGKFLITMTSKGADLIFKNSEGKLRLWKDKKSGPTKKQLENARMYLAEKWTDGGIKDKSIIAVNTAFFNSAEEFEFYLNKSTSGQMSYYKDMKMTLAKFSEMVIRQSTDVAPSKNLHHIARDKGIELPRVTMSVRLAKQNKRDGSQIGNVEEGIQAFNAAMDKEYHESAILSLPMQTRAHRSNKSATTWHRADQVLEIMNSERALIEGAKEYVFTYSQIEKDDALRYELMCAFDKERHQKDGTIKGTRFKVGDVIHLFNTEDQKVPTYYCDMNTIKAVFDPLCEMGIIVMQFAQMRPLRVKVSGQAMTSPYTQEKGLATQYAIARWNEWIASKRDKLVNPQAVSIVPHKVVKGNFHYNTVVTQAAPQMLLKDKKLFNSYVEKQILQSMQRDLSKNAILDVDGIYSYGVVDFGHYFGVEILRHNEVMSRDFWDWKPRAKRELTEEIKSVKETLSLNTLSSQQVEMAKARLHVLEEQLKLVKQNKISQYRSPKMSIYEMDIRTVLSHKQVCQRVDNFVNASKLTSEQGEMLKDMFYNIAHGAIYMSGDSRITALHSGSDWDIDAFTCIFDPAFNMLLTDIKRVTIDIER